MILLLLLVLVLVVVGWVVVAAVMFSRDPEIMCRSGQAEVDMYRVSRSLDGTQLKQDIRRDERRMRRELRDELGGLG